jgi:hypothetical protein
MLVVIIVDMHGLIVVKQQYLVKKIQIIAKKSKEGVELQIS